MYLFCICSSVAVNICSKNVNIWLATQETVSDYCERLLSAAAANISWLKLPYVCVPGVGEPGPGQCLAYEFLLFGGFFGRTHVAAL